MGYKETLDYMRKHANSNKSGYQITLETMGAKFNKNGERVEELLAPDGTSFGQVSREAYKAIESGTLDSYKPKDYEKGILSNFRKHQGYSIKTPDGKKEIGKVSYDGYLAILNNDFENYVPKDQNEKTTLETIKSTPILPFTIELESGEKKDFGYISPNAYKALSEGTEYTPTNESEKKAIESYNQYLKEQREPENPLQGVVHGLGYSVEKTLAGILGGLLDAAYFVETAGTQGLSLLTWGDWKESLEKRAERLMNTPTVGDAWSESAESRYRVPDWYRNNGGVALEGFGRLAPAMATEVMTASASPLGDAAVANLIASGGLSASKVATVLPKLKASEVLFGLSAAGSASKQGYAISGDVGKALNYGVLNGLGEVATERLFAGFAGTGIGKVPPNTKMGLMAKAASKLDDYPNLKSFMNTKGVKKVLDFSGEAVEEMLMTGADTFFQRATVNPEATVASLGDYGESAWQGILLSVVSNVATFPVTIPSRIKAVNAFNETIPAVNLTIKNDEMKFKPLKKTASIEEIQNSQKELQNYLYVYDSSLEAEITANNTEEDIRKETARLKELGKRSEAVDAENATVESPTPQITTVDVGDIFVDSKTNNALKVVARNDANTTIEKTTPTGKTETQVYANDKADMLAVEDRYVKTETSTAVADVRMYNAITSGNLTSKQIEGIITNPTSKETFERLTGVKIEGTKAEQRAVVRDWLNNSANIDSLKAKKAGLSSAHTKVNSLLANPNSANVKNIIRSEALSKAFTDLTGIALEGDMDQKRATVKKHAESARSAYSKSLQYGFANVRRVIEQNAETAKSETVNEKPTTTSGVEDVSDTQVAVVVDAMNETLLPGAEEAIYESMPAHLEKSLDIFAKSLIKLYEKHGTIGKMSSYFSDNGVKVIESIESTLEVTDSTETTKTEDIISKKADFENENIHKDENISKKADSNVAEETLTNQPKNDTVREKTTTEKSSKDDTKKSHTVAYTNDNQKIDLAYKVVDVDDLIASNDLDGKVNPNYPQELQPRDRSRASSRSQITKIASDLNPARLEESRSVSEGAPIVGSDNVVESGNGRTLAIKRAYETGTAEAYRNYIISNAEKFGIDVSNLPTNPVLVRERLTDVDRVEFTRKANESSIGSLSATEQAKVDAERLTEDVLSLLVANDEGEINTSDNKDFISAVLTRVFKNEDLNNVVGAEGRLSARGRERITNAIFYKAYGDASLSARLSESLDNDMKNATRVLLNIAPKVVSIKNRIKADELYNFDFSQEIVDAVRLFEKCRNEGTKLEDYAAQMSLFEKEPILTMEMAYVFETKNRGAKQATDFYNILLDTIEEMGNPNQMSLDIFETFQTKEEIFDVTVEKFNNRVEPKNAIAIPENISGSDSQEGRKNDGRRINEISGNEPNQNDKVENAVGVQHDNGRSKETRTASNDEQLRQANESIKGKSKVTETKSETKPSSDSEIKNYVSGNDGKRDGAVIDEIGNDSTVKSIERDKSDVSTAMNSIAEQSIEMDKPVEIVYVPNANGKSVYGAYFAQTKDSRGGQIASVKSVNGNGGFDAVFGMDFVNESGFMETANGNTDVSTTQIEQTSFDGNPEVVKQLLNQIFEGATPSGIRGQITFTMDDIDVNNFNKVSCALFSEISKYLPESIKSKLGFKSQSFGSIPRYIRFAGVNASVKTGNAVNIDNVDTAEGKYIDVINELFNMDETQRNKVLESISVMPKTVSELNEIVNGNETVETSIDDGRRASLAMDDTRDAEYLELAENPEQNEARLREMVDEAAKEAGYTIEAYHGTSRGDRVGNVFLPERATSGPMAFFTDNREIAQNYSKSKQDTSMAYDPDYDRYETQFRIKMKNGDIPLYRAWGYLPFDARNRITKKAQQLREDWDGDGGLILDPDNREANGGFQWQMKEAKGNTLLALIEQWLNGGTLFNEESRFLEVLEMAGVMEEFKGKGDIYFKDPNARHEKVYDTYLSITTPFDTSLADNSFVDGLLDWYEEQDQTKYTKESMESDLWDKNSIDAYDFADRVRSDIENGTFHAWTSIPDSVTDYLKSLGYDGIKDLGGKNGGAGHTVWIPFYSEQIKSSELVTYDNDGNVIPLSERFDTSNKDIRYSTDNYAPTFYSQMGKVIDELKQDKIGTKDLLNYIKDPKRQVRQEEIKWSGIEAFLEGKKSVAKEELQEFVVNSQLQIEETVLDGSESTTLERQEEGSNDYYVMRGGEIYDTLTFDSSAHIWVSDAYGFYFDSMPRIKSYYGVNENGVRWDKYKLDGGENYREIIFKMPNSDYTNRAMQAHWGNEAQGILAHARVQDFEVDGQKMLFIEEIQSDWHNEGHKKGYSSKIQDRRVEKAKSIHEAMNEPGIDFDEYNDLRESFEELQFELEMEGINIEDYINDNVPDAPFRSNYHEYVLKSLIRMAAEQGYDSIGWTPSNVQSERWSDDYAEGYRIEYDQDIPNFLKRYGKKWGAKVGREWLTINEDLDEVNVWSMPITDSMKDSVLYEGQTLYSLEKDGKNNEREVRESLLSDNSGRTNNESTRKQAGRIREIKQKIKGKTRAERKKFAKELIKQGQVKEVIDGRDKYESC